MHNYVSRYVMVKSTSYECIQLAIMSFSILDVMAITHFKVNNVDTNLQM